MISQYPAHIVDEVERRWQRRFARQNPAVCIDASADDKYCADATTRLDAPLAFMDKAAPQG